MKQNTYNKGRNKNFNPKIKKIKSKPQKKGVDKNEMIAFKPSSMFLNVSEKSVSTNFPELFVDIIDAKKLFPPSIVNNIYFSVLCSLYFTYE